jgi:hypothetical protein
MKLLGESDGRATVLGLTDDLDVGLGTERYADAVSHGSVAVGDDYAHHSMSGYKGKVSRQRLSISD